MLRTLGLFAVLAPLTAMAAEGEATVDPAPTTDAPETDGRKFQMEVGFRGRMVSVPGGVLDIWYENETADFWPLPGDRRPRIKGYAGGLEFLVKGDTANSIFYVEYIKSLMKAGYWDDRDGNDNPLTGEYLEPSDSLGLITLGANYAYEAKVVHPDRTHKRFGWSLLVGGGLGVAFRTGSINRWVQGPDGEPAYKRYQSGLPSDDQKANVPPAVLPMVDINGGMRFTFGDRLSLRFEGGLHTMVYYGTSVGLSF